MESSAKKVTERGGQFLVYEGEATAEPRASVDERTGEVKGVNVTVGWFGGNQWFSFQAETVGLDRIKEGSWLRIEAEAVQYGKMLAPKNPRIISIDGKEPVEFPKSKAS